ncbi:phBC6A51 family helix-turn-helix protein [Clostridium beijerinckii]|uniref:3-deoxy-D-manno-octulosonic-acid transferase n=1 Tax=Clostridium beijerinckii TaxID=1520 RepID=A0AAX0B571_CLOBE|nr:phBC6A51 family helix-turn-helix protein [Clostridium beijerinckii]NRT90044.1 3-deoxy-D-manno-octulosonic-acid transferase [Clostridium beijerinckii]NYC69574.1 3-deoxy-D-manno-octulosonic-acid transferase [Clostridium beijerinckii]UYZ37258.1 phBC6A51 family helix-turn-helix protein [Clostridium beijerinckii]
MIIAEKHIQAINLMLMGNLTNANIAKTVGVSEKTIYNWLDNKDFKAELQKRTDELNSQQTEESRRQILGLMPLAISNLAEIMSDKSNPKFFETNKYIIDRNLGNTTTKIETSTNDNEKNTDVDIDQLVNEIKSDNNVIDISQAK